MKRLGIDLDGCVCDFVGAFYKIANPLFGTSYSGPQSTWDFEDEYTKAQVDEVWQHIKATENFWQTLRPLEGTSRLRYPIKDRELVFITSRVPTRGHSVHDQSCAWLRLHFSITFPLVLVVDKPSEKISLCKSLDIDNFLDDKRSTILQMHNAGLRSYAKLALYNSKEPFPEGVILVETLNEYLRLELNETFR